MTQEQRLRSVAARVIGRLYPRNPPEGLPHTKPGKVAASAPNDYGTTCLYHLLGADLCLYHWRRIRRRSGLAKYEQSLVGKILSSGTSQLPQDDILRHALILDDARGQLRGVLLDELSNRLRVRLARADKAPLWNVELVPVGAEASPPWKWRTAFLGQFPEAYTHGSRYSLDILKAIRMGTRVATPAPDCGLEGARKLWDDREFMPKVEVPKVLAEGAAPGVGGACTDAEQKSKEAEGGKL